MSRIKNLQTDPENIINMVDVLRIFIPQGKSKYVETLLRIMKKTRGLNLYAQEMKDTWEKNFDIKPESLSSYNDIQLLFMYRFIDSMFSYNDLKSFVKFCEYNERGLIENNDLSKYDSFEEIMTQTSLAELKVIAKDLEKQIMSLYCDDEWVVIKPLTYIASRKYGSSTKWCTTQENNPEYFLRYAGKGILIYVLNKKTGLKVAAFKSLKKDDPELSFWNQIDNRIDSMESALPTFILEIIRNEFQECTTNNLDLLSPEDKKVQEDLIKIERKELMAVGLQEQPMDMEIRTYEGEINMNMEVGGAIQDENVMSAPEVEMENIPHNVLMGR